MTWREFRTSTPQQNEFLDCLTFQGEYAQYRGNVLRPKGLMGGAGFGGKSYGLRTATGELNGFFRDMGLPDRWGCLMCKKYTELANRQIRKLETEFKDIGRVRKSQTHGLLFEFYEEGMGGFFLRNAQDPEGSKGAEYDWVLIDELTQFTKSEFDHIDYMLRSPEMPWLPFGAATNPDGIGHDWVKKWWIEHDYTEQQALIDAGAFNPEEFWFIQAMPWHNPTFSKAVEAQLRGFDDQALVQARWEGSWDLAGGMRFSRFNKAVHLFDDHDFSVAYGRVGDTINEIISDPDRWEIYGSLDYGTDQDSASAFYLHAVDQHGNVWTFDELYMQGYWLDTQAEAILGRLEQELGRTDIRIYCDPALKQRDSEGISRLAKFREYGLHLVPAINNRIEGWATVDHCLAFTQDEDGNIVRHPRWHIHKRCRHVIRQLASAPRDSVKLEDVDRKFKDDHGIDSVRYFLHSHFRGAAGPVETPVPLSGAWLRERIKQNEKQKQAGFI